MNHRRLTPKKLAFVAAYLSGKTGTEAAIAAGYSSGNARHRASSLLGSDPQVMQAVAAGQESLRRQMNYTAETAMAELSDAMELARETNNAVAIAHCVQLRAQLTGLLKRKATAKQECVGIYG
jgi:phage terminase small subunit